MAGEGVPQVEAAGQQAGLAASMEEATRSVPLEQEVLGEGVPAAPAVEPVPQQVVATPAEWQGVRDYARSQGIELPYQDDVAALQGLLQAYRQGGQRDYYADLGRRVAPHADALSEVLRARQVQQGQRQAPPPWEPPPFRKDWLNQVERDPETGMLRAKAGYDPSLVEKVQAYADWQDRFREQPEAVLGPLVEDRARKLIGEELAQHRQQLMADTLVAQSSAWMFAADAQGQPVFSQQGQRILTAAGQMYAQEAQSLWAAGVKDVRAVHTLARRAVENAALRQRLLAVEGNSGGGGTQPALAQNPTSVGGGATRPGSSAPPRPKQEHRGLSLREMLTQTLSGFPDDASLG